jgi:hypothetical protein
VKEYRVTEVTFMGRPDPKSVQKQCDDMAKDGWELASTNASAQSGGGRVLMIWEREKPQT